jgi:hypothetical protein
MMAGDQFLQIDEYPETNEKWGESLERGRDWVLTKYCQTMIHHDMYANVSSARIRRHDEGGK